MNPIRIVTDNASDLPDELLVEHNITVVPLDVRLGRLGAEYVRALTLPQFWKLARQSFALPETSSPSLGAFSTAFGDAADEGCAGAVCITMSQALSSTYQIAHTAAETLAGRFPVVVVDSQNISLAEGLLVLEACAASEDGADLAHTAAATVEAVQKIRTYAALDTLDWLRKGGRIGGAQAFLGSVLSIKPIVQIRGGVVEAESRQRTRRRSLRYLVDRIMALGPLKRLAVGHTDADDIDVFLDLLAPIRPRFETVVSYIGPVIGAHTGPGAIGVAPMLV